MKMKLLALAVAGAMVAPMAANAASHAGGTTLYGSVRTHLVNTDNENAAVTDETDLQSGASRLGVKGAEDLGGGLSAVYQYEFFVPSDSMASGTPALGGRLAVVGLKGAFGQVTLGNQWTPYYLNVTGNKDIFNGAVSPHFIQGGFRIPDTVAYNNSFGGVKLGVLAQFDTGGVEDGVSRTDIAASIPAGPVTVGVGVVSVSGGTGSDTDVTGVSVNWKSGNIGAGLVFETQEVGAVDTDNTALNVQFVAGNNVFTAQWEEQEVTGAANDADGYILGWQHNLSKRSRVFVEYASFDGEAPATGTNPGDQDKLSLGMRHDF